jgi:hypothetical protein
MRVPESQNTPASAAWSALEKDLSVKTLRLHLDSEDPLQRSLATRLQYSLAEVLKAA